MTEPRWTVHDEAVPPPPPSRARAWLRSAVGMLGAVCGPLVAAAGLVTLLSSDAGGVRLTPVLLVLAGALLTVVGTRAMLEESRRKARGDDARRPVGPG